jgi:signal transduction histidine kinase
VVKIVDGILQRTRYLLGRHSADGIDMSGFDDNFTQTEHEWRSSVTAITAAAEILRDFSGLANIERDRFLQAIIEESARLQRTFENISEFR